MRSRLHITLLASFMCVNAFAFTPEPPIADPVQEKIAQHIFSELRCMVCEGQSLAESDATLARQMRSEIRQQVTEGHPRHKIIAYFQERYGDEIRMTPPFAPHTYLLWATPLLLLIIGGMILWRRK